MITENCLVLKLTLETSINMLLSFLIQLVFLISPITVVFGHLLCLNPAWDFSTPALFTVFYA